MKIADRRRFRQDPLRYLDDLRRGSATGVIRLPWGGWCVSDADLAHTLLRGPEHNAGPSSFFGELLPSRTAQVDVGHAVRNVLRSRLPRYREAMASAVAALPGATRWPETGADLVHDCLADVLLHPGAPEVRGLVARAVRGGVVFRAPRVWQRARAEVLRAKLVAAVTEQARQRREEGVGEPRDVLDAVLTACPGDLSDRAVAELHLMLFRSIVAPVATSLAWSVLLACLRHTSDEPWPWSADHVLREALRHRPMVWMVGRTVTRDTDFGGVPLRTGDVLSVSPYLLHHDERRWDDPGAFRPERWADQDGRGPYIPFGAGPFTCAGAAVAHELITEALLALTRDARLRVTGADPRPVMAEGVVPRPFTVHRTPHAQLSPGRGGE
ncbi:cytochrome P450 [Saccharothrix sp. HUAS TT1]|uniref:cytochrome P450 n=1 Tax=unclassified Saccharothrix TaxID=2593673 RepID=UPI00345BB7F3